MKPKFICLPRVKNTYLIILFILASLLYFVLYENNHFTKTSYLTDVNFNSLLDFISYNKNKSDQTPTPSLKLNHTYYLLNSSLTNKTITTTTSTTSTSLLPNSTSIIPKISLSTCPLIPPNLGTRIEVDKSDSDLKKIESKLKHLPIEKGGLSSPKECISRYKVAIIVPYRNRETNLKIFLRHMHPFLIKQQLDYGIYLVEPIQNITFNRGLLMNIGFVESLRLTNSKWDCFIFHDVDLIPEDERNIYSCPELPRHMSSAVSTFNYKLPYESIFGGVSALTRKQMEKVNGYSNLYFGWGGEDDDFRSRIVGAGFTISRYPLEIGRYLMDKHTKDQEPNPQRWNLLNTSVKRMQVEGISSLNYSIAEIQNSTLLFTKLLVTYDEKLILSIKY